MKIVYEEDTAAYKVWHTRFLVRITAAFAANPEHIDQYGSATTGDKDHDMDLAMSLITTYRTIPQLAKLMTAGSHVSFTDSSDTLLVYNLVRAYLKEHAETLSHTSVFISQDQEEKDKFTRIVDGIQILIEFVNAVQSHAKIVLDRKPMERMLFNLSNEGVFGATSKVEKTIDKLPEDPGTIFKEFLTAPELKEAARTLEW